MKIITLPKREKTEYYSYSRVDLLPYIQDNPRRILDVGCGLGYTAEMLKDKYRAEYTAGIELNPETAAEAEKKLDDVYVLDLNKDQVPLKNEQFDLIVMSDILEHLAEPQEFLKKVQELLLPQGEAIVSIPNVSNWRVLFMLIFKGDWRYSDAGIMDKTHLRFFTRKSAIRMFTESGFKIRKTGSRKRFIDKCLNIISLTLFRQFFITQYYFSLHK